MTLIERLEAAETGSRELDAAVAVAAKVDLPSPMGDCKATLRLPRKDDDCASGTYWLVQRSGMSLRTAPPLSTSIDAALTLVPKGWRWEVADYAGDQDGPRAALYRNLYSEEFEPDDAIGAYGFTPALALCIAALKAREQTNDG